MADACTEGLDTGFVALGYGKVAFLGIVQGITELLPVSSTAHMRIVPALLGSIFVTMLSNAMDLLEVGGYVQQILLGCVIIAAIFLDRIRAARA